MRALVKDFTLEAGSGPIVMDPIDLSGGYSCTKNKTNISIVSSDLYLHLSLSVASLLLQLENQAAKVLQFGNSHPLATCTNFKQLWVAQRGLIYFIIVGLVAFSFDCMLTISCC